MLRTALVVLLLVLPLVAIAEPEEESAQTDAERVRFADFNRDKISKLLRHQSEIIPTIVPLRKLSADLHGKAGGVKGRTNDLHSLLNGLGARQSETAVIIDIPGAVLFNFDRADLRPDAVLVLDRVAEVLRLYDKPTQINGHTDSVGSNEYNVKLSTARARSVVAYLAKRGIPEKLLSAVPHGEESPVTSNDTAEGRQKNRRVEVVIQK